MVAILVDDAIHGKNTQKQAQLSYLFPVLFLSNPIITIRAGRGLNTPLALFLSPPLSLVPHPLVSLLEKRRQ